METRLGSSVVLGGIVLLGALLAGCGDGEQSVTVEATPEFLAASAERTADHQTARFESRVVQEYGGDAEGVGETTTVGEYDAEADLVAGDLELVIEAGPSGQTEGSARTVQDGADVYFQGFPYDAPPLNVDDDEWVLIELPEELLEIAGSTAETGAVASPAQQLAALEDGLSDVEEVGEDEVRGLPTTHLSATYELPDEALEAFDDLLPDADPPGEMPVDVWVDGEGLIRRYESVNEISFSSGGQDVDLRTSTVIEYFDFGAEVSIEVPEDATPLEDLVPGGSTEADEVAEEAGEALSGDDEGGTFADDLDEGRSGGAPVPGLEGLSPEMQEIAEAMAQLTPEQMADDPCQVVEDPALHDECEMYLGDGQLGG
jgi:hypothetical protein